MLYKTHLPILVWFYAMLLFANSSAGMRSAFLERHLGLSHKTTLRLGQQIRLHIAGYDRQAKLGGLGRTVYIDETLLSGLVADNGRDTERSIVMGFACEGIVLSGIIPNRTKKTIRTSIDRFVEPGSRIVTDGHSSYRWLTSAGWDHVVVDHSIFWSDFKGNHINMIEQYWGVLKRTLSLYRRVRTELLWLYLAECEFRYNTRLSLRSSFDILIEHFPDVSGSNFEILKKRYDWAST